MQSNQIILSGITAAELVEIFRPMVQQEILKIKGEQEERLLSPADVCQMFQPAISKVTLKAWSDLGKLNEHKIGRRVFYKQSEILEAATRLKKYQPTHK